MKTYIELHKENGVMSKLITSNETEHFNLKNEFEKESKNKGLDVCWHVSDEMSETILSNYKRLGKKITIIN